MKYNHYKNRKRFESKSISLQNCTKKGKVKQMICPKCGTWIDAGEPYCPGCMWDGSDDEEEDDYFEKHDAVTYNPYNSSNHNYDSRHSNYDAENSSTQHTHTINNNTGRFENEKPQNTKDTCDPFTCCCGGIILLWILGTLGSLLGL